MTDQITPEALRDLLRYLPESGRAFWLPRVPEMFPAGAKAARKFNAQYAHQEAFQTLDADGYRVGKIWGVQYRMHRVVWAIMTGQWPQDPVDHKNKDCADNRWGNLRLATNSQNQHNRRRQVNNRSGAKGVSRVSGSERWRAQLSCGGVKRLSKAFDTIEEAAAAYAQASAEIHGEFGSLE